MPKASVKLVERYDKIMEYLNDGKMKPAIRLLATLRSKAAKKATKTKTAAKPSAYRDFVSVTIRKLRAENPSMETKVAMKKAAEMWNNMSDAEKKSLKPKSRPASKTSSKSKTSTKSKGSSKKPASKKAASKKAASKKAAKKA